MRAEITGNFCSDHVHVMIRAAVGYCNRVIDLPVHSYHWSHVGVGLVNTQRGKAGSANANLIL